MFNLTQIYQVWKETNFLDKDLQKAFNRKLTTQNVKNLVQSIMILEEAINKTLSSNLHLADGDNCTLIDLKLALKELNKLRKSEL